jgi:starch synthase
MKILMVASEAAPYAKTGGLGDVLGALPAALARLGDEVAVVLPKYGTVAAPEAKRVSHSMALSVGPSIFYAGIDETVVDGVRYFFVDCPQLYLRGGIYGDAAGIFPDNHIRFAALTQAAIAIARHLFRADIFHAHDWQSGLLPLLLKTALALDPVFINARVVFTIHNLGYQGNFGPLTRGELGLDPAVYNPAGLEFYNQVSFMKAGITWADAVTAVSPTYAKEIQTPPFGFSMDGVLRDHAAKLAGILNGVDYSVWSPEIDSHLPARYSAGALAGKQLCKSAVMAEMGLPSIAVGDRRPLLAIVSRFADQKGLDLIGGIAGWLTSQDIALAVLGSGDAPLQQMFTTLAAAYPDKVAVRLGYNEALSHRIEAGADMFLMPSRYEPCGLNQIYSLRYGTVPIVRATGGLADTVDETTGFLFEDFTPVALQGAIADALAAFESRVAWTERMLAGMAKDYSWDASAQAYRDLYRSHRTVTEHG